MSNTYRDKLQDKWAKEFMSSDRNGILHLCPRAGKIRTSIRVFCALHKELKRKPRILIAYPDKNIQQSWEDDFINVGYKNENIEYVTHVSLGKHLNKKYDIIVCDEIHLLSEKQKQNFKVIMKHNPTVLGLSGTLSEKTELELKQELGLSIINEYTLEEAITDGIISDYRINVIKVDLDNSTIIDLKKSKTEKQKYNALTWVIENKGQSLFLNLARMRIIHNSIAKTNKTKDILKNLKQERVLVFCANNKIAKSLGCKVHTSKNNTQIAFEKFISGKGNNHYAVCKIGNTGISFKDLDHIVINAFDSNSENLTQRICRSLILDAPGKISNIYIVTSNEKAELRWLDKALEFFKKEKIKYHE
jgi:superfamily II DNA or RNA helicase